MQSRTRSIITALTLAGALTGAAVIGAAACGDDGNPDQDAVEETIRAFEQGWNDRDFEAVERVHTEAGLKAQLADAEDVDTREGRMEAFDLFTEDDKLVLRSIDDIEVDGDGASALVLGYNEPREDPGPSAILLGVRVALVRDGDDWKIDGLAFVSPGAPGGATSVHVDANEFAFAVNTDEIGSGDITFEVANVGQQPHHFDLEKIPEDLDVEQALQSDEEPEGIVHIGSTPPWEPGNTFNIVFTEKLPAGRYLMICFMPDTEDPEGTPHAFKGMWRDFTIE